MKIPTPTRPAPMPSYPKMVSKTDQDFISIPRTKYEELIRAEAELDVLLRAYQHQSYYLENVTAAVFGPRQKEAERDA